MKRNQFSEEKIVGVLKEHEAGAKVDELCRWHGTRPRPEISSEARP